MKFRTLVFVSVLLTAFSCGTSKQASMSTADEQSVPLTETYSGVIPCADCDGIQFTLNLSGDFTYKSSMQYIGKSADAFVSAGTYKIQDGIIALQDVSAGMKYFKKQQNNLLLLDMERKEISGALAPMYVLKPKQENVEGTIHQLKIKHAQQGNDFFAMGQEPSWSLTLNFEEQFRFSSISGINLNTPAVDQESLLQSKKMRYQTTTDAGTLEIEISDEACQDAMSGQLFDFSVIVKAKESSTGAYSTFHGCGTFTYDLKLHDIWVLEALEGETIQASSFTRGLPQLEIFVEEQRFGGHDGCNMLVGNIVTKGNTISFKDAVSTKMACQNNTKSDLYREAINDKTFTFQLKNYRLILTADGLQKLRFRKID
ncbi:MAG: copper resistance protein NlpE N-terminal domain-containing protein [Bacteroidetes bacterium]|jgi:heat shock protein HslJ/uncharacterized membrane protein|nr:copper resistance protein NlpE N-terminal domain-containing protein [Bacteroidota bacterium]